MRIWPKSSQQPHSRAAVRELFRSLAVLLQGPILRRRQSLRGPCAPRVDFRPVAAPCRPQRSPSYVHHSERRTHILKRPATTRLHPTRPTRARTSDRGPLLSETGRSPHWFALPKSTRMTGADMVMESLHSCPHDRRQLARKFPARPAIRRE